MWLLIVRDDISRRYFDVSTELLLTQAAMKLLRERLEAEIYEPPACASMPFLTAHEIATLPPDMHLDAIARNKRIEQQMRTVEAAVAYKQQVQNVVAGLNADCSAYRLTDECLRRFPLAYRLLQQDRGLQVRLLRTELATWTIKPVELTALQHHQAERQGWSIFTDDDGTARVQRLDELERLSDDAAAIVLARQMGLVVADDGEVISAALDDAGLYEESRRLTQELHTRCIEVCQRHLGGWRLYRPTHRVRCADIPPSTTWIGYRTTLANQMGHTTHFDLNITNGVCYLLDIELEKIDRGQGHGAVLYLIIEAIAVELGCREIRQTPSGRTRRGETREEYLVRRGWIKDGNEVFKRLDAGQSSDAAATVPSR